MAVATLGVAQTRSGIYPGLFHLGRHAKSSFVDSTPLAVRPMQRYPGAINV